MTALESRHGGGLTSDPDSNVLIDHLLALGLVRHIDVWTDEEAERCRLVAFDVAQCIGPADHHGRWVSQNTPHGVRNWGRSLEGWMLVAERFFAVFDPPDFSLSVSVDERLLSELAVWRRS